MRHGMTIVAAACLLLGSAPAARAGPLEFGRVATTFSGRPAPSPSASACGPVLLAL